MVLLTSVSSIMQLPDEAQYSCWGQAPPGCESRVGVYVQPSAFTCLEADFQHGLLPLHASVCLKQSSSHSSRVSPRGMLGKTVLENCILKVVLDNGRDPCGLAALLCHDQHVTLVHSP